MSHLCSSPDSSSRYRFCGPSESSCSPSASFSRSWVQWDALWAAGATTSNDQPAVAPKAVHICVLSRQFVTCRRGEYHLQTQGWDSRQEFAGAGQYTKQRCGGFVVPGMQFRRTLWAFSPASAARTSPARIRPCRSTGVCATTPPQRRPQRRPGTMRECAGCRRCRTTRGSPGTHATGTGSPCRIRASARA